MPYTPFSWVYRLPWSWFSFSPSSSKETRDMATPPAKADATPPWIKELMKVDGLHEVKDFEKLSKWLRSDGKTLGNPTKLPWCGDAVDTAMHLALPDEPRPGDLGKNPYWALNWTYFGKPCRPCLWAVGVFKRDGGGHVGFLMAQTDTHYLVFGGNQGNRVCLTWIKKDQLVEARWPLSWANPNLDLPWRQIQEGTGASLS